MPTRRLTIDPSARGLRVDRFLATLPGLPTRSQLHRLGLVVRAEGRVLGNAYRLRGGETLEVSWRDEPPLGLEPIPMDLTLLYEDLDTLVVDKPRGLAVHPGAGRPRPTLVHGILARLQEPPEAWQVPSRPGIVHRLDRETTGVLLCAKNTRALAYFSEQFQRRAVIKKYRVVVRGCPPRAEGELETRLARDPVHRKRFRVVSAGGKLARTAWKVLASNGEASLLDIDLYTGRTHQIRVHMAHLGCPVLGDALYSRRASGPLLLHAYRLCLRLMDGRDGCFTAPPPEDFMRAVATFGWEAFAAATD